MALVVLNPVFTEIRGAVGALVLYTSRKRSCARRYVVPRNPDTPAQRSNRDLFRKAMKSWQSLGDEEKAAYNRRAARLPMTGHNLYISRYMKTHQASPTAGPAQGPPASGASASRRGITASYAGPRSVAAPSSPVCRLFSQTPARKNPPG